MVARRATGARPDAPRRAAQHPTRTIPSRLVHVLTTRTPNHDAPPVISLRRNYSRAPGSPPRIGQPGGAWPARAGDTDTRMAGSVESTAMAAPVDVIDGTPTRGPAPAQARGSGFRLMMTTFTAPSPMLSDSMSGTDDTSRCTRRRE